MPSNSRTFEELLEAQMLENISTATGFYFCSQMGEQVMNDIRQSYRQNPYVVPGISGETWLPLAAERHRLNQESAMADIDSGVDFRISSDENVMPVNIDFDTAVQRLRDERGNIYNSPTSQPILWHGPYPRRTEVIIPANSSHHTGLTIKFRNSFDAEIKIDLVYESLLKELSKRNTMDLSQFNLLLLMGFIEAIKDQACRVSLNRKSVGAVCSGTYMYERVFNYIKQ